MNTNDPTPLFPAVPSDLRPLPSRVALVEQINRGGRMTAENLAQIRRIANLANLTPGEAVAADCYEEHLASVKAAPAALKAAIDHCTEMDRLADLATRRCQDWFAIATTLQAKANAYELRVRAAEGRHAQNEFVRRLYLRERRRRQALALRCSLEDAETLTTLQAIERWQRRQQEAAV